MAAHKALTHHGMQMAQRQKSPELQAEVSLEEKFHLFHPQQTELAVGLKYLPPHADPAPSLKYY